MDKYEELFPSISSRMSLTLRIFLSTSLEICSKNNNKSLKVIRKNLVKKVREFDGKNLVFVTKESLELPENEKERKTREVHKK